MTPAKKATRRKRRPLASATKTPAQPVTTIRPDPRVWEHALALADGEVKRLTVCDDGSVIVRNQPVSVSLKSERHPR